MSPWCSDSAARLATPGQEDQVSLIWIKESGRENRGRPRDWATDDLPKVKGLVSSKVKIQTQVFLSRRRELMALFHSCDPLYLGVSISIRGSCYIRRRCCAGSLLWCWGAISSYDTHSSLVVEQCSRQYRLSSCDVWACCSTAHGILVPRLGIEPTSPALAGYSQLLDHRGRPSSLYL